MQYSEYRVIVIVVVGLVTETRCNPHPEVRITDDATPANIESGQQCVEDDQICQGLINRLRDEDSWYHLSYCYNYGPQSGIHNNWAHETDPSRTWQKLCPVTCKTCTPTPTNPEPCSDRHPGCTDFANHVILSGYGKLH